MVRRDVSFFLTALMLILAITPAFVPGSLAWSNGGYSSDPANPDYGTHDWIAQHALDWLPDKEKGYILDNLAAYLYGTELPDNGGAPDGIGDTRLHHIYFNSERNLTDNSAALRAEIEFGRALDNAKLKDYQEAAKTAGIMTHYIADMAVFAHVMGSKTDWGNETHHEDYEKYVNKYTSSYNSTFNGFLSFDGNLSAIYAYDAAINLAYDTTFDTKGRGLTAVWMDQNYDWNNPTFVMRVGESLNLAVNYITDVLHTLYLKSQAEVQPPIPPSEPPSQPSYLPTFLPTTIPLWTIGTVVAAIALIVMLLLTHGRPKQSKGKLVRISKNNSPILFIF